MWTKNANLPGGYMNWYQALDYVAGMNAGTYPNFGYTDWRLPNVNELESLVNTNEPNSATWLNVQGFTNVQADSYWSSTTAADVLDYARMVYMWSGDVCPDYKSNHNTFFYVWPVRSSEGLSSPAQVWKTGQYKSYYTGDDGDLERGIAWPSPRLTDHGNGTVTDNLTGLMWTKNANLPNGSGTWQGALDYVAGMNTGTYENFSYHDWRLPNRKELHSLTDYSLVGPTLHPFTNVQAGVGDSRYWSSTTFAYDPASAWVVLFWNGNVYAYNKSGYTVNDYYYGYVWPVRGPEPTLITISSFTATPSNRAIILEWITESEIDNAGFNIYRSEPENGDYVKINDSLIAAEGSPTQGATYQFIDKDVKNRKAYYYKLEDIDLNGKSTIHGPVSATPKRVNELRVQE
jgi:hypothetical protein